MQPALAAAFTLPGVSGGAGYVSSSFRDFPAAGEGRGWALVEALKIAKLPSNAPSHDSGGKPPPCASSRRPITPRRATIWPASSRRQGRVKRRAKLEESRAPRLAPNRRLIPPRAHHHGAHSFDWPARKNTTTNCCIAHPHWKCWSNRRHLSACHSANRRRSGLHSDPVTQLFKQLNELCTIAIHRVYKDEKRHLFPN